MKFYTDADQDGITHLNIYSKAKTKLGRFLSNFAQTTFDCEDGHFESIEGYWYWLTIPESKEREELRNLYGYAAKKCGRSLKGQEAPQSEEFKRKICQAIKIKLDSYPQFLTEFKSSTLPLAHYYVLDDGKVIQPKNNLWVIEYLDSLRNNHE